MRSLINLSFLLLCFAGQAQDTTRFRLEATTSVGTFRGIDRAEPGVLVRQQVAWFANRYVGVAAGIGWGQQSRAAVSSSAPSQLAQPYSRAISQSDLSLVIRPLDSRRHTLGVAVGIGWVRQTTTQASRFILATNPTPREALAVTVERERSAGLLLGATYQYRLSPRFALGVEGRALRVYRDRYNSLALTANYRFNVSAASLGFSEVATDQATWGVRAAMNLSSAYERNPADVWTPRVAGGVWVQLPLSVNWTLRGELGLTGRGRTIEPTTIGTSSFPKSSDRSTFLDATLLFGTEITRNWQLVIGPNLSFRTAALYRYGDRSFVPDEGAINSGLVVGTSVMLGQRVSLDARYVRDVIQFSRNPYNGYQGFQLGTSVRLGK